MKAVFVLAGHGGNDRGASFNGTNERKEVVEIAQETVDILAAHSKFSMDPAEVDKIQLVPVGITEELSLREKIQIVNQKCLDNGWLDEKKNCECLLIEVHVNYAENKQASGVETWFETSDEKGKEFAENVNDAVKKSTKFKDRGVKDDTRNRHGRLGIIRDTAPVGVLVECGFISNDMDARLLKDPTEDDKVSEGIAMGILKTLKMRAGTAPEQPTWYKDVPAGVWYEQDLRDCVAAGIFIVPKNGIFGPTKERTELVAVASRLLKKINLGL